MCKMLKLTRLLAEFLVVCQGKVAFFILVNLRFGHNLSKSFGIIIFDPLFTTKFFGGPYGVIRQQKLAGAYGQQHTRLSLSKSLIHRMQYLCYKYQAYLESIKDHIFFTVKASWYIFYSARAKKQFSERGSF